MIVIRDKYIQFAVKLFVLGLIVLAISLIIKFCLPLLAPFIVGLLISAINEPAIKLMESRLKIPRKYGSIFSLVLTLCVVVVILLFGVIQIYNELLVLQSNITNYINSISNELTQTFIKATEIYRNLPYGIPEEINKNLLDLIPKIKDIITGLISNIISTISSVPKITVFITITLLSSYFISSDKKALIEFVSKQLPINWSKNISGIKESAFTAMFAYFKAQIILVTLTFFEVSIGLMIIRSDYAITTGLIVAISDLIPIFGTSIIMVPMIIWNVIIGNFTKAIGLVIIYYIGVIMRQILEPKIVGKNLGLHPLVTLIAMYVGLTVYGILGMFIALIAVITLKSIQDSGIIKIWKE